MEVIFKDFKQLLISVLSEFSQKVDQVMFFQIVEENNEIVLEIRLNKLN